MALSYIWHFYSIQCLACSSKVSEVNDFRDVETFDALVEVPGFDGSEFCLIQGINFTGYSQTIIKEEHPVPIDIRVEMS